MADAPAHCFHADAEPCSTTGVNPWLQLPNDPPFIQPADSAAIRELRNVEIKPDSIPEPYIGNPQTAKVILLGLNPGHSPEDAATHVKFKRILVGNLHHADLEYPFYPLDPTMDGTPVANWWTRHLKPLLHESRLDRATISRKFCVIEWFPYHTVNARGFPPAPFCPSQQYSFRLAKLAFQGNKLFIGMRARRRWSMVDAAFAQIKYVNNFQNPVISKKNVGEEIFEAIVQAMLGA